ncbi:4-vinyl reductase 4VR [Gloeothece citriformis PCC 7424]|uniref:4-vinyl reductase 4VR n=1 Tax=Gloeothece citriformis (strain PCC 7424) TaxID=65393 RepID=B7KJU5_GLOC7|nr:V4R domain-containing protein [Gloeothece citriformis]ACK69544.1 4-vinyl reductase 4VR [Gloeothece citriformis PCC 7424]
MIDISQLVTDKIPGNYFSVDAYLQGDIEFGVIENRSGSRLLAIPETLLQGLHAALDEEIGSSAGVVLYSCGRWWGRSFYRRLSEELENYYGKPITQMEMIEFLQCLKECWKAHGWGTLRVDLKYYQQGFLVIKITNSPFAESAITNNRPGCFLEAGVLSAFFSQLTGQSLHCTQTSCESMGAEGNYFVLGLEERLKSISAWLEEGHDHATIMELLCRNQTLVTV